MPIHDFLKIQRRALLRAGGALILGAALPATRAVAQAKLKIGVIGSGHIGGTIGTLWVLAVSKRLLEKVISGSSNDAGSFRGLPMP